ncbi:prepilin-type N-terminal cleavage/methylation domain-containing protein [Bacillus sp. CGMCC 1.16541]|uniref:type IV pilus modification PilV family protein n=1 Tax=Bacillus sp. CGMCC 1.16541 TaxID=2185143 RepID=UPI000D730E1F|nr:prepilin-type N-terminal cleavage/methylation domain-containing protein [Bacillus sp. CGMCC 1.16541]
MKKFFDNQGLTLIEVLVSLVILMIIFTGLMQFFSNAYSYTKSSQNKTAGINVARNALTFMEKQSFIEMHETFVTNDKTLYLYICTSGANAEKEYTYVETPTPPLGCEDISVNNVPFTVQLSHSQSNNFKDRYMIPIEVIVEWKRNNQVLSTEMRGAVVSEDIRETY